MDDIVKEAREAIEMSYEFDRENRREHMEDVRHAAGFQWSEAAKAERGGRPMITLVTAPNFISQVSNPIRQNMPVIKVEPDGISDENTSEVVNGLFRRIQYNSSASHVYAHAVDCMVTGGIGWFRIVTEYESDDSFDQEIKIKRIFNPLSVYPDPASLEPDRSTMNWCLVSEPMPRKAFEQRWKGATAQGIDPPSNAVTAALNWESGDYIRVAEYWKRTEVKTTLAKLAKGDVVNLTEMGEAEAGRLMSIPNLVVGTRAGKSHKVTMHLVSGAEELEEITDFPSKWIPLIPIIGTERPLETGVYRHGLIRFQREPDRLTNYYFSMAAETLGQQPKSPWLVTPAQIEGYEALWSDANVSSKPYLLYNPDPDAPGLPQRTQPAPFPAGLVQMGQMLAEYKKSTTGIYDAYLGAKSNETSGIAIDKRAAQGQNATFHYVDNMEHSLEHAGRIILDMIPRVYDTTRDLRLMGEDGTEMQASINTPGTDENGEPALINDMSKLTFKSVRVVLGPSYASRRQETVNNLTQLVSAVPAIGQVGGDIIVRNMDFDGAEQLSERLKALLPPQVMQVENPQAAQAQPDPMQQAQMEAQQQAMQFDLQGSQARSEQEKAKAAQEAAKVDGVHLDNALKAKKLRESPAEEDRDTETAQESAT